MAECIQLQDVKETITCGICLQLFTDPRGLSCGHTYCLVCLKGYQDTKSNKECPVCRALTIPVREQLDNIPVNKLAAELVDLVHTHEPSTVEAPPEWKTPKVKEKPRLSHRDLLGLTFGRAGDLGMMAALLHGLERDLEERDEQQIQEVVTMSQITHQRQQRDAEIRPVQESQGEENTNKPQHPNIRCDECGRGDLRGDRFKCGICDDYDLCERCVKIERGAVHDPEHVLIKIRNPATTNPVNKAPILSEEGIMIGMTYNENAREHRKEIDGGETMDIPCSRCGTTPIIGLRFKCGYCEDYNLCEECEKMSETETFHDVKHLYLVIEHPTQYHPTQPQLKHNFYGAVQESESIEELSVDACGDVRVSTLLASSIAKSSAASTSGDHQNL